MRKILFSIVLILTVLNISAQKDKTDANIVGHVVDTKGEHIPFTTIGIQGTAIGTSTDISGHYQMIDLPEGTFTLVAQYMGYKPAEKEVTTERNNTIEVKFVLEEDVLKLDEVVVTGDRYQTKRTESSTIVNTINPKLFNSVEAVTLSEGLNYCPGLRMESNCQNCGFSQLRINGMEGPYSQVLVNNRPIFSGLAGVYGLELIPSNMIERVEVIRGGGSALYGSNAIAGTVNLILKDPISNTYEFGLNTGLVGVGIDGSGDPAPENVVNFNTSLVSNDHKTGMALYGFYRDRDPFDANGDRFSEITKINNVTVGSRLHQRFGTRSKLTADFFHIYEKRRGGDQFDEVVHMAGIAEALEHNITTGALTFDMFFREFDMLSVYASGQRVNRDSYYGAEQSLSDYGNTEDYSYAVGSQYNAVLGRADLVVGIESIGSKLVDKKLGYPDVDNASYNPDDSTIFIPYVNSRVISDQTTGTIGVFAQYEIDINKLKISAGARFDSYRIADKAHEGQDDKTGNVISPRLTLKYDVHETLQARVSYSQGYRAPQIFDEDLHIETSGARKVIHENDPDLKQETSHSLMASLDYNKQWGDVWFSFLVEGFYTRLDDAFTNEFGEPDEDGVVVYTRVNAENGASVQGVNMEMNLVPSSKFSLSGGFTIQSSKYEDPQEFDEKHFFRTPNDYGYLNVDWQPVKNLAVSASAIYTGKMLVPYFGPEIPDPDEGELRESDPFMDVGLKVSYDIKVSQVKLRVFAGVKNMLNSYQDDLDEGIDRDPGYFYGPILPRTIYFGLKFGNLLR